MERRVISTTEVRRLQGEGAAENERSLYYAPQGFVVRGLFSRACPPRYARSGIALETGGRFWCMAIRSPPIPIENPDSYRVLYKGL